MIKVQIKDINNPSYIKVTGHAEYDESGKDIVCSSVSTAIIMTINQIELFDIIEDINYDINEGYLELKVLKHSTSLEKILKNLTYTLTSLEENYSKYIKLN